MNEEFSELKNNYTNALRQNEDYSEILERMRKNLKNRNGDKDTISDDITHQTYIISEVEKVEELYNIDGILNRKSSSEKLDKIGIEQRRKYGITSK